MSSAHPWSVRLTLRSTPRYTTLAFWSSTLTRLPIGLEGFASTRGCGCDSLTHWCVRATPREPMARVTAYTPGLVSLSRLIVSPPTNTYCGVVRPAVSNTRDVLTLSQNSLSRTGVVAPRGNSRSRRVRGCNSAGGPVSSHTMPPDDAMGSRMPSCAPVIIGDVPRLRRAPVDVVQAYSLPLPSR